MRPKIEKHQAKVQQWADHDNKDDHDNEGHVKREDLYETPEKADRPYHAKDRQKRDTRRADN